MNLSDLCEPWAGDVSLDEGRIILLQGKLESRLPGLPSAFVHATITDGPYHLGKVAKRFSKKDAAPPKVYEPGGRAVFGRKAKGFMGLEWDSGDVAFRPETWELIHARQLPGSYLLNFSGAQTYHRITCAIEDSGLEIRDSIDWIYGTGFPAGSVNVAKMIDKRAGVDTKAKDWTPTTPLARAHAGEGTLLKPAHEPIAVARKALAEKNVTDQVLATGTGVMYLDACRVLAPEGDREDYGLSHSPTGGMTGVVYGDWKVKRQEYKRPPGGRWPPNLIFSHTQECTEETCSEDCPVQALGDRARFFPTFRYCAKPGEAEKEAGLEGLEAGKLHRVNPGGLENEPRFAPKECKNDHATVKPVSLMQWLVRLVCVPDGIVLDPFMGSGTTGIAAALEGRCFIGIEKDPRSFRIAAARIKHAVEERIFQ